MKRVFQVAAFAMFALVALTSAKLGTKFAYSPSNITVNVPTGLDYDDRDNAFLTCNQFIERNIVTTGGTLYSVLHDYTTRQPISIPFGQNFDQWATGKDGKNYACLQIRLVNE